MANPQKENGFTPIAHEIMEALAKCRIPGKSRQMLDVIMRQTYGYGRKTDRISTKQFMNLTGLSKPSIHRARRTLLYTKMITVYKSEHSQVLTYSFQKDYNKWLLYTKMYPYTKTDTGVYKNRHSELVSIDTLLKKTILCEPQKFFYTSYKQAFDKEYFANFGKDGKLFKALQKMFDVPRLKELITCFFASSDKFIKESDYSTGVFYSQINRLNKGVVRKGRQDE